MSYKQAVTRLDANTRRIAADVPVTVMPDDMASEYHWKNPHLIRDGNRFADPAVVEAYAKIAALEAKLAGAIGVVEAARRFALTCESNGFTGEGFDYNPEKLSALRAALASMPQEKA